jgi:hypothetical protein
MASRQKEKKVRLCGRICSRGSTFKAAAVNRLFRSMSLRTFSNKHSLPANPHWVEFPRSDGDEQLWPKNRTRVVDSDGQVNFMRRVPLDEPGPSVKWRTDIAIALARALNWPGMLLCQVVNMQLTRSQEGPSYVLKDWPRGYGFFDHNKGSQDAPRHDLYLMGRSIICSFSHCGELILISQVQSPVIVLSQNSSLTAYGS